MVVEGLEHDAVLRAQAQLEAALATTVDLLRLEELPERFRRRVLAEGVQIHGA